MSTIELIAAGFRNAGERGAPLTATSLEVKNKLQRNPRNEVGRLLDYNINDLLTAKKEIVRSFNNNAQINVTLIDQLQRLEPRVATVSDDDPFF